MADNRDNFRKDFSFTGGTSGQETINAKLNKTSPETVSLNDYNWMHEYDTFIPEEEKQNFPKIIVTEFQPVPNFGFEKMLNKGKDVVKKVMNVASGVMKAGESATNAAKTAGKEVTTANGKGVGEKILAVADELVKTQVSDDSIKAGTELLQNLLSGKFLNIYEIPYVSNDYLEGDGGGWSTSGEEGGMGGAIMGMINKIGGALGIDKGPAMPTWSKQDNFLSHSTEFYLINDTPGNTYNNYKFLRSFIRGSFWILSDYQEISPNLYQIEVPGRFKCPLAAMKCSVTYEGQLRKDSVAASKLGIPSSILIPDAYKLTVSFDELVPNNYNMYLAYDKEMSSAANGDINSQFGKGATGEKHRKSTNILGDEIDTYNKEEAAKNAKT